MSWRTTIAAGSAAALSVPAIVLGSDAVRLLAMTCLLAALMFLVSGWPAALWRRLPEWAREAAGPLLLIVACGVLYAPLLAGDFPVNHDHPVFLMQAWVTGHELIPRGQLTGFSDTLFAGYPANSLYPMGTSLLVCLVKALSLGLFSWETAYTWALFLSVVAYPLSLYVLGRRMGGRLAALAAGVFGIVDRGAWFQGGWDFNLNWGVWSMGTACSLTLLSLALLDKLVRAPGRHTLIGTALAVGGAILFHPMAVAFLGVLIPLYLTCLSLFARPGHPVLWLPRATGALLLGVGLSLFWLLPFVARSEFYEPLAAAWRPFEDNVRGLLGGNLLLAMSPLLLAGGAFGLLFASLRRNLLGRVWLAAAALLLFFASNTFLLAFDALKKFPALAQLQPERFTYLVRAAMLLGSGLLIELLARQASPDPTRPGGVRLALRRALVALVVAPFVVFGPRAAPFEHFAPTRPLSYASESSLYRDLRLAAEFLNELPRQSLGRIALVAPTHEHLLLSLPVYTGLPVFKVGFTPEDNYRLKFESRDPAVWRVLGVSHALSMGPLGGPEVELARQFGALRLYRFLPFEREVAAVRGPGRAEVLQDEPEALDVRISGAGPDTRLFVARGRYALWRAELDGRPVEIRGASVGDSPPVFMEIPVSDGVLRLRYRAGAPEWIGGIASWLAWLSLAGIFLFGTFSRLRALLGRWPARLREPLNAVATLGSLSCGAVAVGWFLLRLALPAPSPIPGRCVVEDLAKRLPRARAELVETGRALPCAAFDGRRIQCPGPEWNFAGEVILGADHVLRQCIWLHPVQGARFVLRFPEVELGEALEGFMGLADMVVEPPSNHDVTLHVAVEGGPEQSFVCPSRRGWQHWRLPTPGMNGRRGVVTISSEAAFTGQRHFCFTALSTISGEAP